MTTPAPDMLFYTTPEGTVSRTFCERVIRNPTVYLIKLNNLAPHSIPATVFLNDVNLFTTPEGTVSRTFCEHVIRNLTVYLIKLNNLAPHSIPETVFLNDVNLFLVATRSSCRDAWVREK